jgi:hypothetical protein
MSIAEKLQLQRDLYHTIPYTVIELAQNLKMVTCRETLNKFAQAYSPETFRRQRNEFVMVRDCDSELVKQCLGADVATELDTAMRADLAASAIDETYRYHFIHAFQDFLTGVIVIDQFYDDITKWFSGEISNPRVSIESAWLMAALFHDQFKGAPPDTSQFVLQDPQPPPELLEEEFRTTSAGELASLYEHLKCGEPLHSWSRSTIQSHPLSKILLTHLKNKNHGVVGGFGLLTHNIKDLHVIYSAALAVALHDKGPREMLHSEKIFPIQMEKFPLVALLLYCDTIQEWNRSFNSNVDLIGINFLDKEVNFVLHFSSVWAKKKKDEELAEVGKCIADPPIKLGYSTGTYLGAQ